MADTPATITIGHLTIAEKGDRIDASCAKCGQSLNVGARFGPIPADLLITEWAKQHVHAPKRKRTAR